MLVDSFERSIADGQMLLPILIALGAGFLTALSPCVYPLIPITLTIMGTRRASNHLQGFLIAFCYVMGMSLVYASLGMIFASIGILVGGFMQQPAVVLLIAALFMTMAASLFGIINVVIPQRMLTMLSAIGGQGKRGAFLMGMVAGILAAPCTGPVLGFILTLVAEKRDVTVGTVLMLAFSLGMGAPFLLLGTFFSSITRLPKSGPWMDSIKYIFGAVILGTSLFYISLAWSPLLDALQQIRAIGIGWMLIFLVFGITFFFLRSKKSRVKFVLTQTLGALLASVTVAAMLTYDDSTAQPIAATNLEGLDWYVIDAKTRDEAVFLHLLDQAKRAMLPVMIDFYADWCVACKQLEHTTFRDEAVARELKRFMLIRVDATNSAKVVDAIENRFKVTGLPTVAFINEQGEVLRTRIHGFVEPASFLKFLGDIN